MKNDMEYNIGQEYAALTDEYSQGGGNTAAEGKSRKAPWKKMMYMAVAFMVMAYTAICPYASDTEVSLETDGYQPTEAKQPEEPYEEPVEVREEQFGNDELPTLPIYPIEDGTSYYVVYNDTYDPDNNWNNRVLEEGFIFEAQLAQGMDYALPEYEPVEGYIFMGWVIYYESGNMGMAGEALTANNICYVKPKDGSRSIEVHAAWRHDGIGKWPHLLTLDANGGTIENEGSVTYDADGPMASGSYVYLCAYPLPVREGYTFTGWYAEPDCNGKQVKRLMGIDFYEKKGDDFDWSTTKPITLYAGWARN